MKKAVIYTRGNNREKQEMFCRVYAADNDYKVSFVTTDINAVANCDALLVSNASRISRDRIEYYKIRNLLKAKGIEIISVSNQDKAEEHLRIMRELLR